MRLTIRGRNLELSSSIRDYATGKLARLDRLVPAEVAVEVELAEEAHSRHLAEATVFTKGPTIHAKETGANVRASIDRLVENLERQLTRHQEKRRLEPRRRVGHHRE